MARSKRNKTVALTKTKKYSGKRDNQFAKIRKAIDSFSRLFVLSFKCPRTQGYLLVRQEFQGSLLMFGKNKVFLKAMGRSESEAYADGLHEASKYVTGQIALLFTDLKKSEVVEKLSQITEVNFSHTGSEAPQTVSLGKGPLPRLSHSLEPQLRQLGLPVRMKRGVIELEQDFPVCKVGDKLNPTQCRILKMFDVQLDQFKVIPTAMWDKEEGWSTIEQPEDSEHLGILDGGEVKIVCKQMDDGQYYFVPEKIDDE